MASNTNKWISVVDQLPPEGESVIARASVFDGKGVNFIAFEARYKVGSGMREKLEKISAILSHEKDIDLEDEPEDKEYKANNWKTSIPFWDGEDSAYALLVSAITHWAPMPVLEEKE